MSDTPRMKAAQMAAMEHMTGDVYRVGCQLERELNAANEMFRKLNIHALNLTDRIKRLEDAGDALSKILTYDIIQKHELAQSRGGQAVRTSTETLIAAMHILATEIQSDDGAANAAVAEAAERLAEQHMRIAQLERENDALRADLLLWENGGPLP